MRRTVEYSTTSDAPHGSPVGVETSFGGQGRGSRYVQHHWRLMRLIPCPDGLIGLRPRAAEHHAARLKDLGAKAAGYIEKSKAENTLSRRLARFHCLVREMSPRGFITQSSIEKATIMPPPGFPHSR